MKPNLERFGPYAREGVEAAAAILVGSRHTAESLWAALAGPRARGAHPPRPAGRRRPPLPAALGRRGGGGAGRAGGAGARIERRAGGGRLRARPLARRPGDPRIRGGRGPAGDLRRQADRLQGGRPAARRLAAGPRREPRGAAAGRRLRRVRRRPSPAVRRPGARAISPTPARSPGSAAGSRAARPAPLPILSAFLEEPGRRLPGGRGAPRPARSPSPAGSSTTRSPS